MAAACKLIAVLLSSSPLPVSRLHAATPTASFAPPRCAAATSSKSPAAAAAPKKRRATGLFLRKPVPPVLQKKRRATGLTMQRPVSPVVQEIVGARRGPPEITRTKALKRLWAYIKRHTLQVQERNHPHILVLQIGNTFCKLPGDRL